MFPQRRDKKENIQSETDFNAHDWPVNVSLDKTVCMCIAGLNIYKAWNTKALNGLFRNW